MRNKIKKKLFVISDIHGTPAPFIKALSDAGFDKEDSSHMLIVLGDAFDRGESNRQTLAYLSGIKNKLLLYGNHDGILMQALCSGCVGRLQRINGTQTTLREFFPSYGDEDILTLTTEEEANTAKELMDYIRSLSFIYETDSYVFTHGWLPMDEYGIDPDYAYCAYGRWDSVMWQRWPSFYGKFQIPEGKTLVVGHTSTAYAKEIDPKRLPDDYSIFYGERFIAIDGTVRRSGRANLLVIEDTVEETLTVPVLTDSAGVEAVRRGEKRVFLELFDEQTASLRVGDILQISSQEGDSVSRRIISLHRYHNFAVVEDDFDSCDLGYGKNRPLGYLSSEMRRLYSFEKVAQNGIIAIVTSE